MILMAHIVVLVMLAPLINIPGVVKKRHIISHMTLDEDVTRMAIGYGAREKKG